MHVDGGGGGGVEDGLARSALLLDEVWKQFRGENDKLFHSGIDW